MVALKNGVSLWSDILRPLIKPKDLDGYRADVKVDGVFEWCIYGDNMDVRQWEKDFFKLQVWKYRFMVPAVNLLRYLQGPARKSEVRKHRAHDDLFSAFDDAFEDAMIDWSRCFVLRNYVNPPEELVDKKSRTGAGALLRSCKQLIMTVMLWDTAYREFFNMLLLRITVRTNSLVKSNRYHHLVYFNPENNINDVTYLYVSEAIRKAAASGQSVVIHFKKPDEQSGEPINCE